VADTGAVQTITVALAKLQEAARTGLALSAGGLNQLVGQGEVKGNVVAVLRGLSESDLRRTRQIDRHFGIDADRIVSQRQSADRLAPRKDYQDGHARVT